MSIAGEIRERYARLIDGRDHPLGPLLPNVAAEHLAREYKLSPAALQRILARSNNVGRAREPLGSLAQWSRANGRTEAEFSRLCFELVRRDHASYGLVRP